MSLFVFLSRKGWAGSVVGVFVCGGECVRLHSNKCTVAGFCKLYAFVRHCTMWLCDLVLLKQLHARSG